MEEFKLRFDQERPYVFVSYKREDQQIIENNIKYLQEHYGINIWYDADLTGGNYWDEEALPKIIDENCQLILFFASEESMMSPNVKKELDEAKFYFRKIIPINFSNRPFDDIMREEIARKYSKTNMGKVMNARELIQNHLKQNLKYIYLHQADYYDAVLKAITRNAAQNVFIFEPIANPSEINPSVESNLVNETLATIIDIDAAGTVGNNGVEGKGIRYTNSFDEEFKLHSLTEPIEKLNKPNGWNSSVLDGIWLMDKEYKMTSFAKLVLCVLEQLYRRDTPKFLEVVQKSSDYQLDSLFKGIGEGGIKAPNLIPGTDIYVESKTNYDMKIKQLRFIFDAMGIKQDELMISLRLAHRNV